MGFLHVLMPFVQTKVYTLIVVVLMVIFALAFMHALNKALGGMDVK